MLASRTHLDGLAERDEEGRHAEVLSGAVVAEGAVFVGATCRGVGEAGERGQTRKGPQRELVQAWHRYVVR